MSQLLVWITTPNVFTQKSIKSQAVFLEVVFAAICLLARAFRPVVFTFFVAWRNRAPSDCVKLRFEQFCYTCEAHGSFFSLFFFRLPTRSMNFRRNRKSEIICDFLSLGAAKASFRFLIEIEFFLCALCAGRERTLIGKAKC